MIHYKCALKRLNVENTENSTNVGENNSIDKYRSFPNYVRLLIWDHLLSREVPISLAEIWLVHKQRVLYDTSGGLRDTRDRERKRKKERTMNVTEARY